MKSNAACGICGHNYNMHRSNDNACPSSLDKNDMPIAYGISKFVDVSLTTTQLPNGRKDDTDKLRMDLIPFGPLEDIAAVLTFGAKKYAPDNWKTVPDAIPRYEAALLRHFTAYKKGEVNDPETGMTHLAHAACCLMFLMHMTKEAHVVEIPH